MILLEFEDGLSLEHGKPHQPASIAIQDDARVIYPESVTVDPAGEKRV